MERGVPLRTTYEPVLEVSQPRVIFSVLVGCLGGLAAQLSIQAADDTLRRHREYHLAEVLTGDLLLVAQGENVEHHAIKSLLARTNVLVIDNHKFFKGDASFSASFGIHIAKELLVEALGPEPLHHDVLVKNFFFYFFGRFSLSDAGMAPRCDRLVYLVHRVQL